MSENIQKSPSVIQMVMPLHAGEIYSTCFFKYLIV